MAPFFLPGAGAGGAVASAAPVVSAAPVASVAMTWPCALSSSCGVTGVTCRLGGAGAGAAAATPGGATTHGRVPITCGGGDSAGGPRNTRPAGGQEWEQPGAPPQVTQPRGGGGQGTPRGTWPCVLVRSCPGIPCTLGRGLAITGGALRDPRICGCAPRAAVSCGTETGSELGQGGRRDPPGLSPHPPGGHRSPWESLNP